MDDVERKERGLTDNEIKQEKILDVMRRSGDNAGSYAKKQSSGLCSVSSNDLIVFNRTTHCTVCVTGWVVSKSLCLSVLLIMCVFRTD